MAIDMLILSSDDIVLITQNVLQTMLGFSAEPIAQQTPGESQTPSDESALITASIAISGAWDGEVELTNMIGGNIKSQVLRPSQLSLPQVGAKDCPPASHAGYIINNVPLATVHGSLRIVVRHIPCV